MIDPDDFAEEYAEALAAADKYVDRAARGIPSDRWAVGAAGARLVARGIMAQQMLLAAQTEALEALHAELEAHAARAADGMNL